MPQSFWIKLLLDATVPSLIYYIFYIHHVPILGAILGITWSAGVITFDLIRARRLNFLSLLSALTIVIACLTLLLTQDSFVYLSSYAINDALLGVVLLISCLFPRSLLQIFLESLQTAKGRLPEKWGVARLDRKRMKQLTILVGGGLLGQAGLLTYLQFHLPVGEFLVIRRLLSGPPILVLLFGAYAWHRFWRQRRKRAKC